MLGQKVLCLAVIKGHTKLVEFLIEKKHVIPHNYVLREPKILTYTSSLKYLLEKKVWKNPRRNSVIDKLYRSAKTQEAAEDIIKKFFIYIQKKLSNTIKKNARSLEKHGKLYLKAMRTRYGGTDQIDSEKKTSKKISNFINDNISKIANLMNDAGMGKIKIRKKNRFTKKDGIFLNYEFEVREVTIQGAKYSKDGDGSLEVFNRTGSL